MADDLTLRILEEEILTGGKRERSMQVGGTVLPGGEHDKIRIGRKKIGREDKAVFSHPVGQTPSGQIQVFSGVVAELDPIRKITLRVLYHGVILDHHFGDDEGSGDVVGCIRTVGESKGRQTEAEKNDRDGRQRSAQKKENVF